MIWDGLCIIAVQMCLFDTTLEEDYSRRPMLVPLSNEWNACNLLIGEKEVSHGVASSTSIRSLLFFCILFTSVLCDAGVQLFS